MRITRHKHTTNCALHNCVVCCNGVAMLLCIVHDIDILTTVVKKGGVKGAG